MGTLGRMGNIRLKNTSTGQQGQKLGHWDPWQTSELEFKILGTPSEAIKGKNGDTGTYGKHQVRFPRLLIQKKTEKHNDVLPKTASKAKKNRVHWFMAPNHPSPNPPPTPYPP